MDKIKLDTFCLHYSSCSPLIGLVAVRINLNAGKMMKNCYASVLDVILVSIPSVFNCWKCSASGAWQSLRPQTIHAWTDNFQLLTHC